jgi:triacylglycerol lipase
MSRQWTVLAIAAAGLCLLAGGRSLWPRHFEPQPALVISRPVNFEELGAMAARANAAYESADTIRQSYPKTILVNSPGTMDVQYFLEQDNEANTQHVTIRGTANWKNVLEDFDFSVHEGRDTTIPVAAGFDLVARQILVNVTARFNKQHETTVTGHSLGGAVAALLAFYLIEDGYNVGHVVTFGQPRFTTSDGVRSGRLRALSRVLTRVVDENDVVPMLPPGSERTRNYGPFEHVGREIIVLDGAYYVDLPNHAADRLSVAESWREWASARLGDHHMANYLARLSTKAAGAVSVPYEDREKFVTRPARATDHTPGR